MRDTSSRGSYTFALFSLSIVKPVCFHLIINLVSQEPGVRSSNIQSQVSEGEAAIARAEATENMANDVLGLLDVRQKQQ